MAIEIRALADIVRAGFDTIIDVRSPSEFAEDHVPGAISLPVLSDEERVRVGTVYVQESPFLARKIGAAMVARNAARHIEGPLADKDGGWRPLVYCWRGGQRSRSFASILSEIGWRVETVAGGYQSYRRAVVRRLYETELPSRVILLDGNTGTAKTEIIGRLATEGVQSIDLEGLANHRGSALGALGPQPSQKAFESRLAEAIEVLDPDRPVVIEAESSKIGRLNLPPKIFAAMKSARRIVVTAPVAARADFLASAYGDVTSDLATLEDRLGRLIRLQGHDQVRTWITLAREGAFHRLAEELIVLHYDPRYAKVRERNGGDVAAEVNVSSLTESDLPGIVRRVADAVRAL